jgi:acyl-CoA synthetase (AMP-forming)/AMP-acid ligase II
VNIAYLLAASARSFGQSPAVSFGERRIWTYAGLFERASQLAQGLRSFPGMQVGDRVALAMKNCPQYIEAMWACWIAGLCAVPINAKLHPREFAFIFENTGARLAFVTEDLVESLAPLEAEIPTLARVICVDDADYARLAAADPLPLQPLEETAPAWLFFTSGTTGRPKGAVLTHRTLLAMTMRYYADIDQLDDRDCMFHVAPLSHGGGLYSLPHIGKASHHIIPDSQGFDPAEIFSLLELYENATFFCAPTMLNRLVGHPGVADARIERIRTIFYGGAPMYLEDLKRALAALGPRLCQCYGQGEMPNTLTFVSKAMHAEASHPKYEYRLSTVGIPRTGVEIRIVGENDVDMPPGEIGEVIARSDVIMAGYWANPEASAKTLRGGWLHTGDLAVMDEEGFVTLKDRSKDMIISGGSNIYPREVEEALLTHPGVLECSVLGRPHSDWGEEVFAFVVPRPGHTVTEAELDETCRNNIARFKRPKAYAFIDALPKSAYGKILKTELRDRLARERQKA